MFKSSVITNINSTKIDKSKMKCDCPSCKKPMKRLSDWKVVNQSFSAMFYCSDCEKLVNFSIRFKEYYDRIDVRTNIVEMRKNEDNEEAE